MTLSEVIQLLALIGGAVFVTFQITWTISNGKRNDRPCLSKQAVILFDLTPEER